ncbi:Protein bric-a-brac 2 [Nymphon striatum]|nr:Protein bric-a-brac 2 [Nymphon striatum]
MFSIMLKSGVGHPGHLRMVAQQFCLRWNNHHVNMLDVFDTLYNSELLVDVTLACEGVSIKAHKVVLSACSSFFQEIFTNNPCKHPVVILKGMKLEELRAVLQFMYRGEVNVTQEQLPSLVKAAESLRVKGLAEMNSNQFEPSNFNTHEPLRDKVHKTQRIHNSSIHNSAIHNSSMRNSVQEPETVSPSTSNCVIIYSKYSDNPEFNRHDPHQIRIHRNPRLLYCHGTDRNSAGPTDSAWPPGGEQTTSFGDQQDVLTDDNQSEKNVSKMSDESSKDGTNETNQSNSHPQLSALLDSSSMKKQPASPMSDTGEDDGYMAHHEYLHQDNSENLKKYTSCLWKTLSITVLASTAVYRYGIHSCYPNRFFFRSQSSFVGNDEDRPGDTPNHYPLGLKISGLSHSPSVDIISAQDWIKEEVSAVNVVSSIQRIKKQGIRNRKNKQYSEQDMEGAIVAVMNNGLSMYRACRMFGVPKETLRHKIILVHNRPCQSAIKILIAFPDDHFLRLSGQQGDENLYQQWRSKRKRYKRYTQETLENAIFAVMQGSLSQKRAAVIYGIPHETLRRHVKDRKDISNPHTILIDSSPSNGIDDVSIMENGSDKMDIKITNEAMSEAISINIESKPSGSCSP